jgi:hypothetical protein
MVFGVSPMSVIREGIQELYRDLEPLLREKRLVYFEIRKKQLVQLQPHEVTDETGTASYSCGQMLVCFPNMTIRITQS